MTVDWLPLGHLCLLGQVALYIKGKKKKCPDPSSCTVNTQVQLSPSKVIDRRSKIYKQLSELKNLKEHGILTDKEYTNEKESIMILLKEITKN